VRGKLQIYPNGLDGRKSLSKDYVEKSADGYRIVGSRVSLDSIVYAFRRGASPESIQRSFPTLTLEEVFGAITFYLSQQSEIDSDLEKGQEKLEKMRQDARAADPDFYEKLDAARSQPSSKSS
jgi:uncharacterized protein (DUF433 family)